MRLSPLFFPTLLLAGFGWASAAHPGTATSIAGLYYTGVNNSGALLAGGARDPHWSLRYADAPGNDGNYEGAAYVVGGANRDSAWAPNTSTAQWITAPGASNSAGNTNTGGAYLPGNGTSGSNAAQFVYRLAFTISGTGSGS